MTDQNAGQTIEAETETTLANQTHNPSPPDISCNSTQNQQHPEILQLKDDEEEELRKLLVPDVKHLPISPPSALQTNFVTYFAIDLIKPGHDQFVHRHANGLCVVGLAPSHVAFKDESGITSVDFNVGKSDRSGIKVTGKRKRNAQHFEPNTALCKVFCNDAFYIVRCCVKGSLLEVNERLIKQPGLLSSAADREGYVAILMPRPADWLKVKASLVNLEDYKKLRDIH